MTSFKTAALFTVFGFLLASLGGALIAAPDKTLGMALMSARVNLNGTVYSGAGIVSAQKVSNGNYRVDFTRPVYPGCALVASITGPGPSGEEGLIVASRSAGGWALVRTYAADEDPEDRPFNLIVFCEG